MKNVYAVIMAGGSGERFWPKSRRRMPKQLLPIISKRSLLQETIARIEMLVPRQRIIIVTNKIQAGSVRKQIPQIAKKNLIVEPVSKNTAPCIAVAARFIQKRDPSGIMVVLPADHYIKNSAKFRKTLKRAVTIADKKDVLATLGIKPRCAHTGYGYIERGRTLGNRLFTVKSFTEKPSLGTARRYVKSGRYYWNSGMFVWKVDALLREIRKYLPKLHSLLRNNNTADVYKRAESVSIDYGLMEKTKKAVTLEADFSWDDVGNWASIDKYIKKDYLGNVKQGNVFVNDTENSTIISDLPVVSAVGVSDLIIVAVKDAVLVCRKDKAEEVKKIVNILKQRKEYRKYL